MQLFVDMSREENFDTYLKELRANRAKKKKETGRRYAKVLN